MSNCLVTGGLGFIGSHLVDALIDRSHEVTVIDNLSAGSKKNKNPKAKFIWADISSKCYLKENVFDSNSFDIIFHLAAKPNVQESINFPEETNETNVEGTHNLLLLAKEYKIPKFIFASSSAIYGDQATLPLVETMTPNPCSPYALHKLICERYCELYYQLYGIKTVSLRYFNVFGPRQSAEGNYSCLIPKAIKALKSANFFPIFGDGKQLRDLIYVDDVIKATVNAAFFDNENLWGNVINVGTGHNYSVNDIVFMIKKYLESNSVIKYGPKVVESLKTLADTTKCSKLLDMVPQDNFKENLLKTIDWYMLND